MHRLTSTLAAAFVAAATSLREREIRHAIGEQEPDWPELRDKLDQVVRLEHSSRIAAFDTAVQKAQARFQQTPFDSDILATLLQAETQSLQVFRRLAIEELIFSAKPDFGRLLDYYRRKVRYADPEHATALPPWSSIAPALSLFLGTLLVHALGEQHLLRPLVPTATERTLLDALRASTAMAAGVDAPPAEILTHPALLPHYDQRITASAGGSIAQVQQTIVQGDLYTSPLTPTPDLGQLYRRYGTFLIETFGMLDFRGIMQIRHAMKVRLEAIYVPLTGQGDLLTLPTPPLPADQQLSMTAASSSLASLHDFVRNTPCLVVLGGPGAGKSTLVRYMLLSLAKGVARQRFGLEDNWLPIFFPVAAFAEARRPQGQPDLAPLDYLGDYYGGLSQPDYRPLFQRALESGTALVLLDGLDEVRTGRTELMRCLEAFVREWDAPGNRFIATSRIAGYDDAPLDDQLFVRVTIQRLGDREIRDFVERWSMAYEAAGTDTDTLDPDGETAQELHRRTTQHAQSLSTAVFANPDVTDMARNPLLLTILALIHNQGARLPDRRADLYRLCVEALAETWNRARSLSGREIDVYLGDEKLDERFVVNLLGPAALWIHGEQPGGMVEQRDLERHLTGTLIQTDGLAHGRAQRLARSFIELMRCDTGLLQEHGYQRFGFMHLTFEEYLAARGLLESVTVADPYALIHTYGTDPRWREVLRLAVATAPQREAQRLLLHILATPTSPDVHGRPVVLAGECLLDIGRNSATQRAWTAVVDQLVGLLRDPLVPLANRVAGGHVLGQLGDPRLLDPGHSQAAESDYWCPVSGESFWYGNDHEEGRTGRTATLREVTLPYAYRIARFPVTNAEYRRFVEDGGYRKRRWWTREGRAFLRPGGHRSPLETPDQPIVQPGLWNEALFTSPSQPVVGVSWYEAVAYCNWLTTRGHRARWLPPGDHLRLPTALEWERAARHTDRRCYPWGNDDPTIEHANYEATRLRAPAPVGCFPAGAAACGALDMAGNVWEWTATLWEHLAEREPCRDVCLSERPVIRGGAFNWEADYLACSTRYWFHPGHRYNLLGFRIVWVSGIED